MGYGLSKYSIQRVSNHLRLLATTKDDIEFATDNPNRLANWLYDGMATATEEKHPSFANLKDKWRIRRLSGKVRCEYLGTTVAKVIISRTERAFPDCTTFLAVLGATISESTNFDVLSFPNANLSAIEVDKLTQWALKANLTVETLPHLKLTKNASELRTHGSEVNEG
jgi:hypothetical protein